MNTIERIKAAIVKEVSKYNDATIVNKLTDEFFEIFKDCEGVYEISNMWYDAWYNSGGPVEAYYQKVRNDNSSLAKVAQDIIGYFDAIMEDYSYGCPLDNEYFEDDEDDDEEFECMLDEFEMTAHEWTRYREICPGSQQIAEVMKMIEGQTCAKFRKMYEDGVFSTLLKRAEDEYNKCPNPYTSDVLTNAEQINQLLTGMYENICGIVHEDEYQSTLSEEELAELMELV